VKVIRVIPRIHNRGSKNPQFWSITTVLKTFERSNNQSHRNASSFAGSLRFSKQVGPAVVLGF
jgi:hypothetical protein